VEVKAELARHDERLKTLHILLAERQEQLKIAFTASEKAVAKAEEAQLRVNATQNEFRGALKDQAATLATKEALEKLDARVQNIEKGDSLGAGKEAGVSSTQALVFKVLPIVVSIGAAAFALWKK